LDGRGEQRLAERPREQLRTTAGHRCVADGRVGPGRRDRSGDRELLRRGLDRQHLRRAALGPVLPHLVLRRVRGAVAAGPQAVPSAISRFGDTAVGSSRLISWAKESLEPLCGVAEARTSASVFGASTWASWLFCVDWLVTLWDSSITTASQR